MLFRGHQEYRGTSRSLRSESSAAVKWGEGRGGSTRSDEEEVKIRDKIMMLIMQKRQSSRIKEPITEGCRDFLSVRKTCRRCGGIDRQSTDLIVNQDRRVNREINSLSANNCATTTVLALVTLTSLAGIKMPDRIRGRVLTFFFCLTKFVKQFLNSKSNAPHVGQ